MIIYLLDKFQYNLKSLIHDYFNILMVNSKRRTKIKVCSNSNPFTFWYKVKIWSQQAQSEENQNSGVNTPHRGFYSASMVDRGTTKRPCDRHRAGKRPKYIADSECEKLLRCVDTLPAGKGFGNGHITEDSDYRYQNNTRAQLRTHFKEI